MVEFAEKTYGINVHQGGLATAGFEPASFDAITFWDALEHVPDPLQHLQLVAGLLKDNGVLIVNYPNYSSIFAGIFKDRWWYMVPVHLFYFTPRVLNGALSKLGFDIAGEHRHWQTLELAHVLKMASGSIPAMLWPLTDWLQRTPAGKMTVRYYAGQLTLVARRRPRAPALAPSLSTDLETPVGVAAQSG